MKDRDELQIELDQVKAELSESIKKVNDKASKLELANGQVDFFRQKLTNVKAELAETSSLKEKALKQVKDIETKQKDVEILKTKDRDETSQELDQVKAELSESIKKVNDKASKLELAYG